MVLVMKSVKWFVSLVTNPFSVSMDTRFIISQDFSPVS